MSFVHLHNHTEYSLLDGAVRVRRLMEAAGEKGMPAVAITDHGYMYGAVEAAMAGAAVGVKAIIGCEVYVAPRSLYDKDSRSGDDEPSHLVLLAMNDEGYRNLVQLVSVACVEGFYYKPRVDRELLQRHSGGIICLSACIFGEIPRLLLAGDTGGAKALALEYSRIFGGRFYLELQRHGLADEDAVNPLIIAMARETGIPLVATNDVHYLNRSDARYHDVMLCMQTGKRVRDTGRMRFPNDQFFLKDPQDMRALFADVPEAVENTLAIADMCNVSFRFGDYHLPSFPMPEGHTEDGYLRELCMEGIRARYGQPGPEVTARLEEELGVISRMGFPSYFLVVWDFIRWAKANGIAVGPGRGSSAGSIVAYALGITDVEPLRYGLLFERFLNPERVSMPDIDVDFDDRRRLEVIDYVTRFYGQDRVAQITTFGTLKARSAIRDVARALDVPLSKADRLAKLVPYFAPTVTGILDGSPDDQGLQELAKLYKTDPEVKEILDCARFVEGFPRHASVHAAGVVITRVPVGSLVPLARSKDGNSNVTQYPMGTLEKLGLLKMDFLGLSNLNVIRDAVELIRVFRGVGVDIDSVPLDDPKTLQLFATGQTIGTFQFESSGMRQMLQEFKPQRFEDLVLLNAAYRPGPMQMIPSMVEVRHGRKQPEYLHPLLEPILKETYGSIVYQEQVMQITKSMAGFSLGRADLLRRAMGKKQRDIMDKERVNFVEGAAVRGIDRKTSEGVYDLITRFAEYGFPKPHAVAYSMVAFQTGYLKAHYTVEFMAAKLTSDKHNASKVAFYINECRRLGVRVLPPDVNTSGVDFQPAAGEEKAILFALSAIRNVGGGTAVSIMQARASGPFKGLQDLCSRAQLNKRELEGLIKAGACRAFGRRSQLLAVMDTVAKKAGKERKFREREEMQFSLLAKELFPDGDTGSGDDLPDLDEVPAKECLAMEKEFLGLYVSGHPLDSFSESLSARRVTSSHDLGGVAPGTRVTVAGVVTGVKKTVTKKGADMAFVTLEDHVGSMEVIVFPTVYRECARLLREDAVVFVTGKNDSSVAEDEDAEGDPKVEAKVLADAVDAPDPATGGIITITIDAGHGQEVLSGITSLIKEHRGRTPIYVNLPDGRRILTPENKWVEASPELMKCLEALVGKRNCSWTQNRGA